MRARRLLGNTVDTKKTQVVWNNPQDILDHYEETCHPLGYVRSITLFCREKDHPEALCMIQCREFTGSPVAAVVSGQCFGDLVSFFVPLADDFRCEGRQAGKIVDGSCSRCSRHFEAPTS